MPKDEPRIRRGAPASGVILIFLGILFLLQTTGLIPWSLWGNLWRYWPVIFIIAGLNIILRHLNPWLVSLLILIILGIFLTISMWQQGITIW